MIVVDVTFADDVQDIHTEWPDANSEIAGRFARVMEKRPDVQRVIAEADCPFCDDVHNLASLACGCGFVSCPSERNDNDECETCAELTAESSCGCGHYCSRCTGMTDADF